MGLDHLVYAVPDLAQGRRVFAQVTGVEPVPGGVHPGRGTANALVALGGQARSYLELLGPDPEQPDVASEHTMLGVGLLGPGFRPRLLTWAVAPEDIDVTASHAREQGVDVGEVVGSWRTTPGGTELTWRLSTRTPLPLDGVQPFLIDWAGGSHPTDDDLPALDVSGLSLMHPDADRVRAAVDALGVSVPVTRGLVPGIRATLHTPRGPVLLH